MKKITVFLLAMVLFATLSFAGSKTAVFNWKMSSVANLKSWNIKYATVQGGPYTLLVNIPYVSQQTTYTSTQTVNLVPDGTVQTLYFVCSSIATSNIESANSNEASGPFDFTTTGVPIQFTITIS
jgi:hypothetical protein